MKIEIDKGPRLVVMQLLEAGETFLKNNAERSNNFISKQKPKDWLGLMLEKNEEDRGNKQV